AVVACAGEDALDLARPWQQPAALLAEALGRAGLAVLVQFTAPMLAGAVFFALRLARSPLTWLVFAIGVALAAVVNFGIRFLLNLTAFWLLDWRGVFGLYWVASGVL